MHGETSCLEIYRQLHCAAYNLLISIISCTQTDQKFYTAFLFSENQAKVNKMNKSFYFAFEPE